MGNLSRFLPSEAKYLCYVGPCACEVSAGSALGRRRSCRAGPAGCGGGGGRRGRGGDVVAVASGRRHCRRGALGVGEDVVLAARGQSGFFVACGFFSST